MAAHHTLRRILVARGMIDRAAPWVAFAGGRTNALWRVGTGRNSLVCKLFHKNGGTPLFPNDPAAETATLQALTGTGLAPEFLAAIETGYGPCLLYRFVDGPQWSSDTKPVGAMLARLHQSGIRPAWTAPFDPASAEETMLGELPRVDRAAFSELRPAAPPPEVPAQIIHGDPVPANIVLSAQGPVLIDWQCPRLGDPADDLAVFLSPAMQQLYGGKALTEADVTACLTAYGHSDVTLRYRRYRPYYLWRMALHCAGKARKGDAAYGRAMSAELDALQQCSDPSRD